ncbi:MAG: 30S ribosomal protein S19e [Candidatus Woesearchaeota archaeon]
MVSFRDKNPMQLNNEVADKLKQIEHIKAPQWAAFVKTGGDKTRPPVNPEWWYNRCAAILVSVATLGPIGVNKLRVKYGGKKRRGHKPAEFTKASGNIIRKALQQLEAAKLIEQKVIQNHKGRVLTSAGQSLLNKQ